MSSDIMTIDIERTRTKYGEQLDSFMKSFIMTCSPFTDQQENLEREAEARKDISGYAWIEHAGGFCSYRKIDKIISVHNEGFNPYLDIRLEPSSSILTSNWFLWPCAPCFEVPFDGGRALGREYGEPTRSTFLDIDGSDAQLDYLKRNVGGRILQCYVFDSENDFGKMRWCYRFAKEDYLRESLLITQGFVLDFMLRHPLDCFNGPYLVGQPEYVSACAGKTKLEILGPVLNEYLPIIRERKAIIDADLLRRGLIAESI